MAAVGFLSKELNDQDIASSVGSFQPDGVRRPSGNNDLGNAKNLNRSCVWGVLGPSSSQSHSPCHSLEEASRSQEQLSMSFQGGALVDYCKKASYFI